MAFSRHLFTAAFILLWFLLPGIAHAQTKQGKVLGVVTDSSKKALSAVTIQLTKGESQVIKQTLTNNKGMFEMTIDTGNYFLNASHSGYINITTAVSIKEGENVVEGLVLHTTVHSLQNVTVTARRSLIEQADDKITYNVENDPAAKTETASEILRKTPLVSVDGDGNVQVNGQSNFKILLNGRETSMFAMNVKDALQNFPGAVISKIEVITSPSAKYDAEGVGGIINIITKKKVIGYNVYLNSYFSTLSNYSQNASFNLKSGKIGISGYIGASGSFNDIKSYNHSETTPLTNAIYSKRTLNGERVGRNLGNFGNIEIVYDIDSFKTIAAYGNLGGHRGMGEFEQDIITLYPSRPQELSLLLQDNENRNYNSGVGADFIQRFAGRPDKELSFRFNGQFSNNNNFNNSIQQSVVQNRYVSNESRSNNKEYTLQLDFIQPLKNKQKLETGVKAILRNASSDFQSLIKYKDSEIYKPNPANTDKFNYHQEVYSVYTSYTLPLKTGSIRGGVRGEYTNVYGDFVSAYTEVKQSYFNVVPNFLITRKFSPIYTLSASYNMRLQRPYITNLNPFVNNNDSLNISYGNPKLGPQALHAVSFQNRFTKGKLFTALTLNGSYTNSMIVQFAQFDPQRGVTSITYANIGREFQSSLVFNLNTPIGEKLNAGINATLRYNKIENKSNVQQSRKGISGSSFFNFNYRAVGKFTISGSGGIMRNPYALFNTPLTQYFYQVNFGYKFLNDKLSVTMNVNNFHDRFMTFRNETIDQNFKMVSSNTNPYRVLYFGINYNFGKLKENVSKKKGVSNDDLVQ